MIVVPSVLKKMSLLTVLQADSKMKIESMEK